MKNLWYLLLLVAPFLLPSAIHAQQIDLDDPAIASELGRPAKVDSSTAAQSDSKQQSAPDVVVDLSEIDGLAEGSTDPLQSPVDIGSQAATWFREGPLKRWTRQPLVAAALSIGLVWFGYWFFRMVGGRGSARRPGRLSRQVIELIGFVPLNAKQQLQLVRLGSKLVLVAVSANGAEPLAEITDPVEVDQILAACNSGQSALASAIGQWTGRARSAHRDFGRAADRRPGRALYEA